MDASITMLAFVAILLSSFSRGTQNDSDNRATRLLLTDVGYSDTRIAHLESVVNQLLAKLLVLEQHQAHPGTSNSKGGSVYIRWGSKSCPNITSTEIYTGYAGGGYYSHAGAGINYVCLPSDPIYGNRSKSLATSYGYIYGGEYETNFFGTRSQDEDVPCAVCATDDANMMMIPGRNTCYPGWTTQYYGYLASSYYRQAAQSDYVCVDDAVEYVNEGRKRNDNGALFYPVVGSCGSLQCPPYVNTEPLTCVVCTHSMI